MQSGYLQSDVSSLTQRWILVKCCWLAFSYGTSFQISTLIKPETKSPEYSRWRAVNNGFIPRNVEK